MEAEHLGRSLREIGVKDAIKCRIAAPTEQRVLANPGGASTSRLDCGSLLQIKT
jgi:hypothetical protein